MHQNNKTERYHKAIYAAKALKVSRITIYRHIKEGRLEAERFGRNYYISETAFFRYLNRHRMPHGFQDGLRIIFSGMRDHLLEVEAETLLRTRPDKSGTDERD